MEIVDRGKGPALVVVPGVQGRWEWSEPAVDALAESFRVLTFSLADAPSIDQFSDQIRSVMDASKLERAAICGISFGGFPALRFAARHPNRTSALILASVPGPNWRLRASHAVYARHPRIFAPLFFATAPRRLNGEISAAIDGRRKRWRFRLKQLSLLASAPLSPSRMAHRARMITATDIAVDCKGVQAPTLVLTGEPHLDHVVTVGGTREYAHLIRGASLVLLERTGHLGSVTRPHDFAAAIRSFLRTSEGSSGRGSDAA